MKKAYSLLTILSNTLFDREPLVAALNSVHPLVPDSGSGLHLADMVNEPSVFFPRGYGSSLYSQLLNLARAAGFSPHIAQEAGATTTLNAGNIRLLQQTSALSHARLCTSS